MSVIHAFEGYGLEMEYMIVDRQDLSVRPIADRLLDELDAAGEGQPLLRWSNELTLHVVELKNPEPVPDLAVLRCGMQMEIRRANRVLAGHGAVLMPGAVHPWMDPRVETRLWPRQHHDIYETYHRLFDCFGHGWANLQSIHLNLPFANDEEFARVHAAARLITPIIPALAAASPVVEGQFSGFADFRMHAYGSHQARLAESIGQVIPPNATSREQYQRDVLEPMFRALDALEPSGTLRQEWLNVRALAPRFSRHALEVRNIDSQECPKADLAVAKAISAVVQWLYAGESLSLAEQQSIETSVLVNVFRKCVREGGHALVLEPEYLKLLRVQGAGIEAGALWKQLIRRAQGNGVHFDAATEAALCVLLNQGTLARRVLRAIDNDFSRPKLESVWRQLVRCLQEDELFPSACPS